MNERTFLLGVVPHASVENAAWRGWIVVFSCRDASGAKPLIGLYSGPSSHDEGASAEAAFWFEHAPSSFESVNGQVVERRPSAGWFERVCREIGADWFVPIAARLRTGEIVPLPEIQAAHVNAKGGEEMREGTITSFFRKPQAPEFSA